MQIQVIDQSTTYILDGEIFVCMHQNAYAYEADGGWYDRLEVQVHCPDCNDEHMDEFAAEPLIQEFLENKQRIWEDD